MTSPGLADTAAAQHDTIEGLQKTNAALIAEVQEAKAALAGAAGRAQGQTDAASEQAASIKSAQEQAEHQAAVCIDCLAAYSACMLERVCEPLVKLVGQRIHCKSECMQAATELRTTVASLQQQLQDARANADAAIAQAKPPPQDDTAVKQATSLQEELAGQQRVTAEAKKRIAVLENALECKEASCAALRDDIKAAGEAKTAIIKELQGESFLAILRHVQAHFAPCAITRSRTRT